MVSRGTQEVSVMMELPKAEPSPSAPLYMLLLTETGKVQLVDEIKLT